jgi:hypothetical protein
MLWGPVRLGQVVQTFAKVSLNQAVLIIVVVLFRSGHHLRGRVVAELAEVGGGRAT